MADVLHLEARSNSDMKDNVRLFFVRRTLGESDRVTRVERVDVCTVSAGSISNQPYDADYNFAFAAKLEHCNDSNELRLWVLQKEDWGKGEQLAVNLYRSSDSGVTWTLEPAHAGVSMPVGDVPYGCRILSNAASNYFPYSDAETLTRTGTQ